MSLLSASETVSYNVDDLEFTVIAVGAIFIILLLIKHWRAR